jgi:hypothetical protein
MMGERQRRDTVSGDIGIDGLRETLDALASWSLARGTACRLSPAVSDWNL